MSSLGADISRNSSSAGKPDIEPILAQIDALPTLPVIATRLLEMTMQDHVGMRDVVDLISSDQSLSARFLSLVNRAGTGSKATTVDRAAVLLGLNVIRNLVLSIQIFETFTQRIEESDSAFDQAGFWKHSLAVGCAARLIAEKLPRSHGGTGQPVDPEEAFMCGLLHDLGKVVLDSCFPKSYARVVSRVDRLRENIGDAEREVFGIDHTLAGKRLAAHWKLPGFVSDCIWLHHHTPSTTPTRLDRPPMVHVIQAADRLVRELRIGYSGSDQLDVTAAEILREAGRPVEWIDDVKQRLPDWIEARAELIGLERLTSREIYQDALAQANSELARLNMTLQQANRRLEQRSVCLDALRRLSEGLDAEALHEEVGKAAVQACAVLLHERPIAVVTRSSSRKLAVMACLHEDALEPDVRTSRADPDIFLMSPPSQVTPQWHSVSEMSPVLADELEAALGRPPRWGIPLSFQDEGQGILVVASDIPPAIDEALTVLLQAIDMRWQMAEGRSQGLRLNEELVEMNRALKASQADLARARSLLMVGEMAAGAAHEMNNPLAVISGRAQMLLQGIQDAGQRRSCELIAEHAHRASEIITELVAFAKPDPPKPDTFALEGLLGELRRDWVEGGAILSEEFVLSLSDELPKVLADAAQIKKLFDEVIRNAIDAMQEISPRRLLINCTSHLTDERVVVIVKDNGRGIPPELIDRVATPFFSHRQAGRGRGLGLSIATRYAEINGGGLRIQSRPNEGTVVLIALPSAPTNGGPNA